jgi:hypothetical protein
MRQPFRYIRDPLFVTAVLLFLVHRVLVILAPEWRTSVVRGHFGDLLLVPVALPPLLWVSATLGYRPKAAAPSALEVSAVTLVWAVAFELVGPAVSQKATSDPLDVLAYAAGGFVSWGIWSSLHKVRSSTATRVNSSTLASSRPSLRR